MRKLKILIITMLFIVACTNDFSDWNRSPKQPEKADPVTFFSYAQWRLARLMTAQSVNYNIFNFFAQYWTATTYTDEANYNLTNRDVGGVFWDRMYTRVLVNLKSAKKYLQEEYTILSKKDKKVNKNKQAIVSILEVLSYHIMVDTYGNVPYTKALNPNNELPSYDSGQKIYEDLFIRLDKAIADLDTSEGSFGSGDFIYQGSVQKWKKFAHSIKLRMALRTKDSDKIKAAVAGGVFENNDDSALFGFLSAAPYSHPLWESLVQSGRSDLVVAKTFTDTIKGLNDPRVAIFMKGNIKDKTDQKKILYSGGPYGESNSFSSYTHVGEVFEKPALKGTIMDYAEVAFLLSEAAARSLGDVTDAKGHYDKGVKASIDYWTDGKGDSATYLAQSNIQYDATKWEERIGFQKWIACYSNGFEGWTTFRIFGIPKLKAPKNANVSANGEGA